MDSSDAKKLKGYNLRFEKFNRPKIYDNQDNGFSGGSVPPIGAWVNEIAETWVDELNNPWVAP